MTYDTFLEQMKTALESDFARKLPEKYSDVQIGIRDVEKLQGESYRGISFKNGDSPVEGNLNMENAFHLYENGRTFTDILQETEQAIMRQVDRMPQFDLGTMMSYQAMKSKLMTELIPQKGNEDRLAEVPHEKIEDLALIYRVDMGDAPGGRMTSVITNQMMAGFGISQEQLHQDAIENTQNLYEKKLVTYPRTDSRYLTDDMAGMVPGLVEAVASIYGITGTVPVNTAQVINSSKVTDHHAIIPTKSMPQADSSGLPSGEQAILKLIAARLIAAVGETHRYAETTAVFTCAGQEFAAKGKSILYPGWKNIESRLRPARNRQKEETEPKELPVLKHGDVLDVRKSGIKEGKSTAPRHFTEDTLLQAMKTASADEFPEEVERKGIGTPATRAGIIEKLVQKGFIERRGDKKTKFLCATNKGTALITVMPEQIQSPSMTADWEEKLLRIEKGEYSADSFMGEITDMIASLVQTYETVKDSDVLLPARTVIGICPHCGKEVVERKKGWFCENRACRFALWKDNAFFNTEISIRRNDTMNDAIKAGEVFKLAELVPYAEGKIVNMDVVHNDKMKFVVMAFDEGTGLSEHAAPGEAIIFALDGEGVIGYEGKDHPIKTGENFHFAKAGLHSVKATKKFKMALLLTLE